jgi:hypothetical protein
LQVVSAFAIWIRHRVDFVDDFHELLSILVVVRALDHDLALGPLSDFRRSDFLLNVDGLLNVPPCILLDEHEFDDIQLFILYPVSIELFENGFDLLYDILDGRETLFFADSLIRLFCVV